MLGLVAHDWWVFAIRGIAALVFGILAFIWPETTLTVLVILFGAYVLVDGVALLVALARGDAVARRHAWAVGIMGVLGIIAGVVTFAWPGLTTLSLLYVVAFWAIVTGTFQVIAAVALRRELDNESWMALGGVASIIFGVLLVAFPGEGLISLVWLVGLWSVVFGVSSLGLADRLHKVDKAMEKPAAQSEIPRRRSCRESVSAMTVHVRRTAAWTEARAAGAARQRRSCRFVNASPGLPDRVRSACLAGQPARDPVDRRGIHGLPPRPRKPNPRRAHEQRHRSRVDCRARGGRGGCRGLPVVRRRRPEALFLVVALVGTLVLADSHKLFFQRPRPGFDWAALPPESGFPSGHSMNSFVVYLAIALVIWRLGGRRVGIVAIAHAIVLAAASAPAASTWDPAVVRRRP